MVYSASADLPLPIRRSKPKNPDLGIPKFKRQKEDPPLKRYFSGERFQDQLQSSSPLKIYSEP
jgi:hypothetical protein